MRKGLLAVTAVVLVGGGYVAAQVYSSERFDDELTRGLKSLEESDDVTIERQNIKQGWFTSSGEIVITPKLDEGWNLSLPYSARHGLSSTRLSGELELAMSDQALFADKLEAAPPRWHAEIETLSGNFTGRLDLAAIDSQVTDSRLISEGGFLTLEGQPDDVRLAGEISPWELRGEEGDLKVGRLTLSSRYQQDETGQERDQQASFALDSLMMARDYNPTVELADLSYQGDLSLGAEELQLGGTLKLGEARVDDEPLLSGELAFSLSHINAEAVRTLEAAIDDETARGTPIEELSDAEFSALLERLEPQLLALFVDSPTLTLDHLAVQSDMLSMDTELSGELTFDGEGAENLSLEDLGQTKQRLRWVRRLNGQFDWQGVPPMAVMQLGLPMTTERLNILIENGRPTVNGRPLPPLL
ncbi:uncharacterized protein YdgA (DUF945 family) [Onishia taeanensis]|uniref:Uncharacterized protein YdgA (DUF945 family) n=1 Tax=Onishia taeanensis TaxID=284577 RepID=A0A328XQT4_9GAMM|nr:DUF945 family protein [Halomonas taeanensis]RAR62249.1 uncharacterized protein YdgA (DUF945 family) [Halomonas taeanensis]